MAQTLQVRGLTIGQGTPKVCTPIVAAEKQEIYEGAMACRAAGADLVEWRADWFAGALDAAQVEEVLARLTRILDGIPLLFTFRTAREGGERALSFEDYAALNRAVARTRMADLVDVELSCGGDDAVGALIADVREQGAKVVASSHDFDKTPDRQEILGQLCKMQRLGADIPKIAVMPTCEQDVLTLLDATLEMRRSHADRPIVAIAMGGMGLVSRLAGEVFGSAITFGSAGRASAPGQIAAADLKTVLDILHAAL